MSEQKEIPNFDTDRVWLSEDNRFVFKDMGTENPRLLKPQLDQLAARGLAPHIEFETKGKVYLRSGDVIGDRTIAKMSLVEGIRLYDLRKTDPETLYSVKLAKSLAELSIGLYEVGLFHNDMSGFNVLFEKSSSKCVAVDLDALTQRGDYEFQDYQDYIVDYCDALLSVYLGESIATYLQDVVRDKGSEYFTPATWDEFSLRREQLAGPEELSGLLLDYAEEPLRRVLEEEGIISKADPSIIDFALKGLNRDKGPKSFDEILNLPEEAA